MRVEAARSAAGDWVREHASHHPGYRGAYVSGSTVDLPDGAELPAGSDLDVVVVSSTGQWPTTPGKLAYRGVLLDVSYLAADRIGTAEQVLGSYHLAGGLRRDTILDDPTGHLRRVHTQVAAEFADPARVRLRCLDARHTMERRLAAVGTAGALAERVSAWLFGTGGTAHVVLVAALRNPTVRLRYLAAREVLAERGLDGRYPELLALLGCADLSRERVARRLDALAETFDATAAVARTRFFFSSDISAVARPIAIDGSRALVARGDHREAVFWIIATFARCHTILARDAPEVQREHLPAFLAALADLGISSGGDLVRRSREVSRYLPRLWRTAQAIVPVGP